jgi:surface polysaccharide O-acyltransferase-like enzyme
VILIHTTASIWRPFAWPRVPDVMANTLARFAVPLFIVLSGFYLSLHHRNEQPLPLYRRTLPGLIRPYLVYTTIYILVATPDVWHLLRSGPGHFVHGTASPHLWFLPVVIELYLCHPFLRRWYSRMPHHRRIVAGALVLQSAYAALFEVFLRQAASSSLWMDAAVTCTSFIKFIGYFVLGYALRDHAAVVLSGAARRRAFRDAAVVWLATGLVLPVAWVGRVLASNLPLWIQVSRITLEWLAVPLTVSAFVMLTAWPRHWTMPPVARRAAEVCGLYSFGVYFLHPLVLMLVARLFYTYARPLMAPGPQKAVLLFVPTVIGTVFVVKWLARSPLARYVV